MSGLDPATIVEQRGWLLERSIDMLRKHAKRGATRSSTERRLVGEFRLSFETTGWITL
jgi:hypothetical protein